MIKLERKGAEFLTSISFSKSWRSFSPITVCILAQCQCRTQPPPPPKEAVSVLKEIVRALYDTASLEVWRVLGWFGWCGVFR